MRRILLSIAVLMVLTAGCSGYKPRPEGFGPLNEAKAEVKQGPTFSVNHTVKGNRLYVDCFTGQGKFAKSESQLTDGDLFITVSVDGKEEKHYYTPAFSMVMDKGYHELTLKLHKYKDAVWTAKSYTWTVKSGE